MIPHSSCRHPNEGPEQAIPMANDRKNAKCDDGGHRHRNHYSPDDGKLRKSVEPRRVHDVVGDRLEELSHQKDAEGRHDVGEDQHRIGVQDTELVAEDEQWQRQDFVRKDQGDQDQCEHQVLPPELKLGKCIRGWSADQNL